MKLGNRRGISPVLELGGDWVWSLLGPVRRLRLALFLEREG